MDWGNVKRQSSYGSAIEISNGDRKNPERAKQLQKNHNLIRTVRQARRHIFIISSCFLILFPPLRYVSFIRQGRGRWIKREQKIQQPRCFCFNCSKTAMGDGGGGGGGGDNKKRQTEFPNMLFGGCLSNAAWETPARTQTSVPHHATRRKKRPAKLLNTAQYSTAKSWKMIPCGGKI